MVVSSNPKEVRSMEKEESLEEAWDKIIAQHIKEIEEDFDLGCAIG